MSKLKVPVQGLMYRMARAIGVELSDAQADGLISPDTVERMNRHCAACAEQEDCAHLLAHAHDTVTEPPDYCPNRKIMIALKASTPPPEDHGP